MNFKIQVLQKIFSTDGTNNWTLGIVSDTRKIILYEDKIGDSLSLEESIKMIREIRRYV